MGVGAQAASYSLQHPPKRSTRPGPPPRPSRSPRGPPVPGTKAAGAGRPVEQQVRPWGGGESSCVLVPSNFLLFICPCSPVAPWLGGGWQRAQGVRRVASPCPPVGRNDRWHTLFGSVGRIHADVLIQRKSLVFIQRADPCVWLELSFGCGWRSGCRGVASPKGCRPGARALGPVESLGVCVVSNFLATKQGELIWVTRKTPSGKRPVDSVWP